MVSVQSCPRRKRNARFAVGQQEGGWRLRGYGEACWQAVVVATPVAEAGGRRRQVRCRCAQVRRRARHAQRQPQAAVQVGCMYVMHSSRLVENEFY